jgi:hypothetical protein
MWKDASNPLEIGAADRNGHAVATRPAKLVESQTGRSGVAALPRSVPGNAWSGTGKPALVPSRLWKWPLAMWQTRRLHERQGGMFARFMLASASIQKMTMER